MIAIIIEMFIIRKCYSNVGLVSIALIGPRWQRKQTYYIMAYCFSKMSMLILVTTISPVFLSIHLSARPIIRLPAHLSAGPSVSRPISPPALLSASSSIRTPFHPQALSSAGPPIQQPFHLPALPSTSRPVRRSFHLLTFAPAGLSHHNIGQLRYLQTLEKPKCAYAYLVSHCTNGRHLLA